MILESFQLKSKNALVTGSSRGLGAAIAIALAEAGANVGCHGRSEDVRPRAKPLSRWEGIPSILPEICPIRRSTRP